MGDMEQRNSPKPGLDRELIGSIIEREIPRNPRVRNVQGLAFETRLSRDTIYRAIKAGPNVEARTFARIEAGLDLPTDTLITAGKHDLQGLVEIGCSPDLIGWIRKEMAKNGGTEGLSGSKAV